ncbi:MAG: tetratricopeptide repeat protein [Candidatus Aminicenantes bacterium]|nr:MAG: tetratricopeptide repeat protein [Candidatus Aminicenantes bacterium]
MDTLKQIMIISLIVGICVLNACSTKAVPKTEFEFGNHLARQGLWKEAYYRWNRALEQGKESAALYNNIAIALEEMGKFEEAEKAYQKALKLSPNNQTVQGNYNKFKKMLTKDKDKNEKDKKDKK